MTNTNRQSHEPTAASTPSESVQGEIIGLEGQRVRVRLESGQVGFVTRSNEAPEGTDYSIGQRGLFQIDQPEANGETMLIVRSIGPLDDPPPPQQKPNLHHSIRSQRPSSPPASSDMHPTMDEQQIKDWLRRVEKSLTTLRRNRTKRLNEEFYSGS